MTNPIELEEHPKYKGMFYLRWKNGKISENFWNLPRANDILRNFKEYKGNTY